MKPMSKILGKTQGEPLAHRDDSVVNPAQEQKL